MHNKSIIIFIVLFLSICLAFDLFIRYRNIDASFDVSQPYSKTVFIFTELKSGLEIHDNYNLIVHLYGYDKDLIEIKIQNGIRYFLVHDSTLILKTKKDSVEVANSDLRLKKALGINIKDYGLILDSAQIYKGVAYYDVSYKYGILCILRLEHSLIEVDKDGRFSVFDDCKKQRNEAYLKDQESILNREKDEGEFKS